VPALILAVLTAGSWPDSVTTLALSFDQAEWEYACEHYSEDIWMDGVLESESGTFQVSFRIRGQTSRQYPKKSIKVQLLDGELYGYSELNLNAEYYDRTRIRECLSYEFHRFAGLCVPETGLLELVFNGETQGPYLFVQDVDGDFAASTILPDDAVIYKARVYGSSLNSTANVHLYLKKTFTGDPPDDLELLIAWLVNSPDSMFLADLASRVHLDQVSTFVAVNVLIGHGSTYYHNYHAVLDSPGAAGRWRFITWDMDRTWGRSYGSDWPYYSATNGNEPPNTLIWRCWCTPVLREAFLDRLWQLSGDFVEFSGSGIIDSLAAAVRPLVEVDPFRDYTMEDFEADLNMVENWPSNRIGQLSLMDHWPLPFRLVGTDDTGGVYSFTWTDAGPGCSYTLKVSSDSTFEDPEALVLEFTSADTTCSFPGWTPPAPPDELFWTVFVDNGIKAEQALNMQLTVAPAASYRWDGQVVINEICYQPSSSFPSGDWVELVNTGSDTLSLAGWSFRDGSDRHLHTIGAECLPPGGYLVLYTDSLLFLSMYPWCPVDDDGFDFGLSSQGDVLRLYDLSGRLVDRVPYLTEKPWPELGEDATLALKDPLLDNSDPASWMAGPGGGTPGMPNDSLAGGTPSGGILAGRAYPSPCTGAFSIEVSVPFDGDAEVRVFDLSGRMVLPMWQLVLVPGDQKLNVFTTGLPPGLYFTVIRYRGSSAAVPFVILDTQ
jgi:hypothetical protein